MVGPADPDRTALFEGPPAFPYPFLVKPEIFFNSGTYVPCSLVDRCPPPGMAGESPIGEVVGRVSEDEVDRFIREFTEYPEAVSAVQRKRAIREVRLTAHGIIITFS